MDKYTVRHDKKERSRHFLGDGKLALGIVIGSATLILLFVAFEFFYGPQESSTYIEAAPVVISLFVAMGSTYIAASALSEQRKAREASTDPVLVTHLGQREDARELVTFKISNVGAGPALKVHLQVETPSDTPEDADKRDFLQNIFRPHEPFTVIPHGSSIEFNLALGWYLLGQDESRQIDKNLPLKPLPPFKAKLSYEDLSGDQYTGEFTINVLEMKGFGSQKSPQMRLVSALEQMAKTLEKQANSLHM